jgi:hypothetical protein
MTRRMTQVIPTVGAVAHAAAREAMAIRTVLPNLAHWKAQVKCQAGCPVSTDAGRYVQLIADGRLEDAFLVARAPNPLASVCGRRGYGWGGSGTRRKKDIWISRISSFGSVPSG